jgi:pimeloyl-ACP methyl ester carboxylesterase
VLETLKEASDALSEDVSALIRQGPAEALALTTNTQPVMLVAAVAAYRVWRHEGGAQPAVVAGHSLGEYSALVASGVLTLAQAAPLVRFRAAAMQEAVPVGVGAMAAIAVESASQAYREGVGVTVIDPRWVKPLPQSLVTMAQRYKSVVVLEDGIRHAGIASSISELFREAGLNVAIHSIGVPLEFIEHSKRAEVLEDLGITAQKISRDIGEWSSTVEAMQFPERENADRKQIR